MLFFLTSRLVSSIAAFLYPGYASYKTLSQRPASEADLERWLMYWSVLGCIVGVEYVAEWLVSWVPFYYTMKTLFLVYLALPQTRGSTYLYTNHLQPFFHSHESQIDAALASLKSRIYTFLQDRVRLLWEHLAATVSQQQQAAFDPAGGSSAVNSAAPPNLGDPISGPVQLVSTLWRSYGPAIIASGSSLLRQSASARATAPPASTTTSAFLNSPAGSSFQPAPVRQNTSQSVLERKRQLEAELASLAAEVDDAQAPPPEPIPIPAANTSHASSRPSSTSDMRERVVSGTGKFEQIEVPSDAEDDGAVQGDSPDRGTGSTAANRTSWFGWGGASASKGGYERVKTE